MSDSIDGILKSSLLGREIPCRVLLPENYGDTRLRFPVLYLLHGLFGSFENWTTLTGLSSYAAGYGLIIVMPEGGDNWYVDARDGEAWESYLIKELIPEIEDDFRTIAPGRGRVIAGNSMGGYGAFKLGLKYPQMFALAASFSGAFNAPRLTDGSDDSNWEERAPSIMRIFGEPDSDIRSENDLERIVVRLDKRQISELPYFYFDCGSEDSFLPANRELSKIFSSRGLMHEFHELEGGHDWNYWNLRGRDLLDLVSQKLDKPQAELIGNTN